MAESFFDAEAVADLRALALDGFATRAAVAGTVPLALSRLDPETGAALTLPPQDVLMTFADRQPRRQGDDAVAVTASEGVFERVDPFDVQPGDRFALAGGASGYVSVAPPAQRGIRRAGFVLEQWGA